MVTPPVQISPKGQIVLPKVVRQSLKSLNVVFEITDTHVIIKPVPNMSGVLSHYKKNYDSFTQVREQTWEQSYHDR